MKGTIRITEQGDALLREMSFILVAVGRFQRVVSRRARDDKCGCGAWVGRERRGGRRAAGGDGAALKLCWGER